VKQRRLIARMLLAVTTLVVPAARLCAQDSPGDSSSKKPATQDKQPKKKNKDSATVSAPDQPTWDPLRAEKDIEVGRYYMKKGDVDAAIDRFQDAITAKPGYAIPFRYLAEAQEKKGQKREALKSYTRYLDLYPHAEDAVKVRKQIDKLWSEIEREKKSAS
jgi:tetratricopeptide (TPR) repeat protein